MNVVNSRVIVLEENQDLIKFQNELDVVSVNHSGKPFNIESSSDLIIDKAGYNVYLNGEKISFPKKEFELLLLLASNPRKVFKRDEILQHVWGKTFKPKDSRSLDVHIRMLRKKLNDHYITTIRGVGYKLEK